MASGSPRTRINQFFASKKRKSLSPGLNTGRTEKVAKTTFEGSPSAKGTLDNYLVTSDDDNRIPRPLARQGPVKRNLTLEINLSSEEKNKYTPPSAQVCSQTFESCTEPQREISRCSSKADDVASRGLAKDCSVSAHHADNSELKQFASDFLSLYCSGLPSKVCSPSDLKANIYKRHGSPSLLDVKDKTSKKRHCLTERDQSRLQGEATCSKEKDSEDLKSAFVVKTGEMVLRSHVATEVIVGNDPTELPACLRKCNKISKSSINITECLTPGLLPVTARAGETPKSLRKSFIISPGEEFWNEAIQVADGLFAPTDNIPVQHAEEIDIAKNQYEIKNSYNFRNGSCEEEKKVFDKDDRSFQHRENIGSLVSMRKHLNSLDKDISPLPVKHFDFFSEEKNLGDNNPEHRSEDIKKGITHRGGEPSECGSVNHKGPRTSNILLRCGKAQTSREVHKVQGTTPTNTVTNIKVDASSQDNDSFTYDPSVKEIGKLIATRERDEASTPSSFAPLKDCLDLSNWLPSEICSIYRKRGISKLYSWQVECLQVDGVLQKRNLVYCASTSAGKSFVAEILMLRRVILTGKMALLVLPYVSLCAEKAEHLEVLLEPVGKHVRSYYGNQGGGTLPKDTSVAVCTIEKANSLINRLLEEGRLSELGIIVIDELHMVGDQHRGYLLELMLTKLRYAAGEGNAESSSGESSGTSSGKGDPAHGLQIVGMSATMPNVAAVADWLQAALYQTEFRPVPLEEYIKVGNTIYNKNMDIVRTISKAADLGGKDPDHVVELCNEVVQEGHSVLIFCSSRKGCESTARHVSKFLKKYFVDIHKDNGEFVDITSAIDALRRCPAGLDPVLEETLPSGVAYHHAGLTVEEREIVESCYRKGLLRVLTATSTLAAGVNLPARRVIFRQPRIGRDFIDGIRYRQMAGRAGRTGIDTKGESVLLCKPEEIKRITGLLNDSCPPLHSCLSEDKNGMTHAILEVVAGGIVQTANDINRYVRCTLLNSTKPFQDVVKSAQDSLRWLCHGKFLEWNDDTKLYSTTPLGRAAFGSSLCPEESLIVLDDLLRAREGFVLASDLHVVYLVTPINVDVEPDWELYYERFMQLSPLDQKVGKQVGVEEPFLMRMAHGAPIHISNRMRDNSKRLQGNPENRLGIRNNNMMSNEQTLRVCKRFYVSLILSRLVQEAPVAEVCEAFKVARGMVQALQENAGRFASMVSLFCERIGWHDLEGLVAKFQNRVSFGVRAEIVELTTIPNVKGSRARALYKAGLRTPLAIAEASIPEIAKALYESSSWTAEGNLAQQRIQLGVAKKIKNGARKIVLDKAEEARVAAFSALKSLGVNVPQFSRPILTTTSGNPSRQEVRTTSSGEDATSSFIAVEHTNRLSAKPSMERIAPNKAASDNNGENATKNSDVVIPTSAENSTDTIENPSVPVEGSVTLGDELNSPADHSENAGTPISTQLGNTGGINKIYDAYIDHGEQGRRSRENMCLGHKEISSEKGPVNANNISGGLDSFLDLWDTAREFCFDVHFNKLSNVNFAASFEIHGMAICWENSPVYYVHLPKDLLSSDKRNDYSPICSSGGKNGAPASLHNLEMAKHRWNRIVKIMGKVDVRKFTWNLKIQIQVLKNPAVSTQRFGSLSQAVKNMGVELIDSSYLMLSPVYVQEGIDMSVVAWILWPDEERSSSPNLEKEIKKRLSVQAAAAANRNGRWKNQMRRAAHNGCCRRVAQIRALCSVLWKLLFSEELFEALMSIEIPLVNVLADMEVSGIGVDMEGCLQARHLLGQKLRNLEKEAYRLAGMKFSLYMTADIANVLYGQLKLPIPEGFNKGKRHPSTDKHCLDSLRDEHPIVPIIKLHRTLSKLLNCTLGSICKMAKLSVMTQKYTLHGHWLQTSTATGRLSMEEPNLQCVEHMIDFKMIKNDKSGGDSDGDNCKINARDFFIPTQENWLLLTADYSQIELRLMAHFSKDSSLIDFLSKPQGDVFTMIAARWTRKLESNINSQERDQTKRLVYGILYGMGPNTLAEQLDCSSSDAAEKIRSFKSSFPGVASWLHDAVTSCRQKGYVQTLKGRKRFLSKIKSGNNKEKSKAQRQAVNSICQGSAADLIKIAMINIYSVISENAAKPYSNTSLATKFNVLKGRCRILLQVHDELIMEVDPSVIKEAAMLLETSMESAVSLLVPLHVKVKVGKTWGSLEQFRAEHYKDVVLVPH